MSDIKEKLDRLIELEEQQNELLNDIKQLQVRQNIMLQGVLSKLVKRGKKAS